VSKSFCFGSREPKKKSSSSSSSLFCKKVCFVCSSSVFGRSFGDFSGYTFISRKTNRARAHTLHKSTSSSSLLSEKNERCHRVNHHFRVVFCDDHQKSSQIDDQQTRIIFVRRVVVVRRIFSDWRKRRRRRK